MFRSATLFSLVILTITSLFWIAQFCMLRPKDLEEYAVMIQEKEVASSTKSNYPKTHQQRKGVRKDIWVSQEDQSRLQYRIDSMASVLTLIPKKGKFEVVENLENIKCWMQDKLYYASGNEDAMQQARYLEADRGEYRFNTQEFIAQKVGLSLFRIPGHTLPKQQFDMKKAYLKGVAQDVSFSLAGKIPHFHAQDFKASLNKSDL